MMLRILFPLLLIVIAAVAFSFFFEISYLGSITLLVAVWFFGGLATEGEYMPGQIDNLDGKELHPFIVLGSLVLLFIVMVVVGYFFPNLYNYGVTGS